MIEDDIRKLDSKGLASVCRAVYETMHARSRRRLHCMSYAKGEPLTLVLAGGPEWSRKVALLYQTWYARELYNTQVPTEFEAGVEGKFDEFIEALILSLSDQQVIQVGKLLWTRDQEIKCPSTLAPKVLPTPESSSSEKPQDEKKKNKADHSSVEAADFSTICSKTPDSDEPTST